MKIGILAVQGAFAEHEKILNILEVETFQIRQEKDLENDFDGLILPGGESTVMGKLLKELNMFDKLRQKITEGLPVMGTCAGLILLAEKLSNDDHIYFGTLPVTVKRNAYGRQLGSFYIETEFADIGKIPMTYIRAPYIEDAGEDVEVLSKVDGHITGVRYKNQLGISFHPELNNDTRIHEYFLLMCQLSERYLRV